MRKIIRSLFATLTLGLWMLALSTLDYAFVIMFLVIAVATWAITRLLSRYSRLLARILLGTLIVMSGGGMLTEPTFRAVILQLIREILQLQGARLFVWAVLCTVILGVMSLARRDSRSA